MNIIKMCQGSHIEPVFWRHSVDISRWNCSEICSKIRKNSLAKSAQRYTFFMRPGWLKQVLWALLGKQLFLSLQKQHLVAKNELAFSFRLTWIREKTNKRTGIKLMFHVDVNMKKLGIPFINDSFQWFRVDSLFLETITLYTLCTFRFKTLQDVFIHWDVLLLHYVWNVISKMPFFIPFKRWISREDCSKNVGKYQGLVQSILSVFSCPDAHIHAVTSDSILWKSRCCLICFLFYILEHILPRNLNYLQELVKS